MWPLETQNIKFSKGGVSDCSWGRRNVPPGSPCELNTRILKIIKLTKKKSYFFFKVSEILLHSVIWCLQEKKWAEFVQCFEITLKISLLSLILKKIFHEWLQIIKKNVSLPCTFQFRIFLWLKFVFDSYIFIVQTIIPCIYC